MEETPANHTTPVYLYGGSKLISDVPLPELKVTAQENHEPTADFSFSFSDAPSEELYHLETLPWVHQWPSSSVSMSLARTAGKFVLRFSNLSTFIVSENMRHVEAWAKPGTAAAIIRHLLLNQVLPRLMSHRGQLVLHASAVRIGPSAIAFAGETGRGKSTLAASLHTNGFPLFADDGLIVSICEDQIVALPTYTGVRLSTHSIDALFPDTNSAGCNGGFEKQRLFLPDADADHVPLAGLYLLVEPVATDTTELMRVSPRDACIELIQNSFQLPYKGSEGLTHMLRLASRVATQIPVFELTYPRNFDCLPAVGKALVHHHQEYRECGNDGDRL